MKSGHLIYIFIQMFTRIPLSMMNWICQFVSMLCSIIERQGYSHITPYSYWEAERMSFHVNIFHVSFHWYPRSPIGNFIISTQPSKQSNVPIDVEVWNCVCNISNCYAHTSVKKESNEEGIGPFHPTSDKMYVARIRWDGWANLYFYDKMECNFSGKKMIPNILYIASCKQRISSTGRVS